MAGTLALFCLASFLVLVNSEIPRIFLLDDAGYADSYILYDIQHFQTTGVIYRDLLEPPYQPAQYSPMVYVLYSLPGRVIEFENPFVGPRLVALLAYLSCVAVVVSNVRTLIPARHAWVWGLLLANTVIGVQDWLISFHGNPPGTVFSMLAVHQDWVIALRGDLLGIVFSLLALRLLLTRSRPLVLIAGLSAGFATLFKITLVTALVSGSVWLLCRKRWGEAAVYMAAGAIASAGLYALFWVYEARMFSQMMALSPGILDVPGSLKLIFKAISQPVVLLALPAFPSVTPRGGSRWTLLLLFTSISFVIACFVELQAGGNINYFFEALFALIPAAVLGTFRLTYWARRSTGVAAFFSGFVLLYVLPPKALDLYRAVHFESGRDQVASSNELLHKVQNVLRGRHIFSTVPRFALLDPAPVLTEPYLASYQERLGKFDPRPILKRIQNSEFDVVITAAQSQSWRGIPHIAPDLHRAIEDSYQPQCTMLGVLLHLPRSRSVDSNFLQNLNRMGCVTVIRDRASSASGW